MKRHDVKNNHPGGILGLARLDLLAIISVAAICFLALGVLSFTRPTTRAINGKIPYTQSGSFTYQAPVSPKSPYGVSLLTTGDPVLLGMVPSLTLGFTYQLSSLLPTTVSGTEQLVAVVSNNGFSRVLPLQQTPQTISGQTFSVKVPLNSAALMNLATNVDTVSGGAIGQQANVAILPQVHLHVTMGQYAIKANFNPPLNFSLTGSILQLSSSSPNSTSTSATLSQLKPVQNGNVLYPSRAAALLPLDLIHPSVASGRGVALGGLLICLALALILAWPLKYASKDEVRLIDARYGPRLLPVARISLTGGALVEVESMAVLTSIANRYKAAVLHQREDGKDSYAVLDNGVVYRYQPVLIPPKLNALSDRVVS